MTSSADGTDGKKSSGRMTSDASGNAAAEWCIQTGVFGASASEQSAAKGVAHPLGYDPYSSADTVKAVNKLKAP
jgi:hypothetical protein